MTLVIRKAVRFAVLTAVFAAGLFTLNLFDNAYSANLSSVTVELDTPRLSYYADMASGMTAGTSIITIDTTGPAPSTSVANLFEGDTVKVGMNEYTVLTTVGTDVIELTSGLSAGDNVDTAAIIATRSATLTATFDTVSAINGGSFRVLVPAASAGYQDGLPDQTGWDYTDDGATNVTLVCPGDDGGHTFGPGTKSPGSVTLGGQTYHSFVCPYTGAGSSGQNFSIVVAGLINPAASSGHTVGTADQYRILVQHLDSGNNTIDQTSAAVALIESVKVTASVAPQITFTIGGVASSTSVCGISTSVTSTATLVPLGELAISQFRHAAQSLTVSTNANDGYVVTAAASDQLARPGVTCTGDGDTTTGCIPDSAGDGAGMTPADADEWTNTSTKGFGYTLAENTLGSNAAAVFEYNANNSGGACGTNTDCYRQFADLEDSENPATLFSSTDVADNDSIYVCYKAVISSTQAAAEDYETDVTYRATATF
jgi:hypothetical protein